MANIWIKRVIVSIQLASMDSTYLLSSFSTKLCDDMVVESTFMEMEYKRNERKI